MEENKKNGSNHVSISGNIISGPVFSHEVFGEKIYQMEVQVKRNSGYPDIIPVLAPESMAGIIRGCHGEHIQVVGQYRSYNKHEEKRSRLVLSVFANEILLAEEYSSGMYNRIFMDGFICRQPEYRVTPNGKEITDVMLAVNRSYHKSDYIPCICWGKYARAASRFYIGEHVQAWGRIQSREYVKKREGFPDEIKIAYEVSIDDMIPIE